MLGEINYTAPLHSSILYLRIHITEQSDLPSHLPEQNDLRTSLRLNRLLIQELIIYSCFINLLYKSVGHVNNKGEEDFHAFIHNFYNSKVIHKGIHNITELGTYTTTHRI